MVFFNKSNKFPFLDFLKHNKEKCTTLLLSGNALVCSSKVICLAP